MKCLSSNRLSGPDGVEAWTVALAACIISFVMAGLARMSGILYVAFIDVFEIDRREASLPFSIRSSMRNLFGPVVGILGQKYGVRPVAMIGAIICASSAGICFYARDIIWITVLWGGISGIGAALATTLNQAVIGQHFRKYRTTAAGMAFSGGCVGAFLFPVLLEYLLYAYGLQGTFLIMSGILMHVIPASMLLRKPRWSDEEKSKVKIPTISENVKNTPNIQGKNKADKIIFGSNIKERLFSQKNVKSYSLEKTDTIINSAVPIYNVELKSVRKISKDLLWDHRKFILNLLVRNSEKDLSNLNSSDRTFSTEDNEIKEVEDIFSEMFLDVFKTKSISADAIMILDSKNQANGSNADLSSKNIQTHNSLKLHTTELTSINNSNILNFLSIALKNLLDVNTKDVTNTFPGIDSESLVELFDELRHIQTLLNKCRDKTTQEKSKRSNSFCCHIKTACNLYTKPIFLLICLCRTVHMMIALPLFTTIVDFSMDKGLPKEDGKYVIGALSLGDLLGRLCLGWISDQGYVNLPKFMMIGMIFQGAFLVSLSITNSKATLLSALVASGLLQGSLFVRHPVLVHRYLASHEQSIAMGCLNFFSGLLSFVMPIYIGFFRDTIGSYNGILYINGAVEAFIGLLWGFETYIVHLSRCPDKKNVLLRL